MGNYSVYLDKNEKRKIENVAASCNVPKGNIMRIIIRNFPEDYIKEIIENYKEDFKRG